MRRGARLALLAALACAPPAPTPPAPAGLAEVSRFLDSVVTDGGAPGAVLGVSLGGCHYYHGTGRLGLDDPSRPDSTSIYDLASLTKVVALTTVVMLGVERGALDLDAPVDRYVPEFLTGAPERRLVTLRHLLTHSSGLPAGRPLYRETASRVDAIALLDTTPLAAAPGERFTYSDLGAMLLTQAAERALGARIDTLLERTVLQPLGLRETRYLPPREWLGRSAPTEQDPWRGRMIRGEVHDENAARLEGVSGHAGLFGSARDLLRFGDWLLAGLATPRGAPSGGCRSRLPPPPAHVAQFIRRQDQPAGSSRALGWDTPSGQSTGGSLISRTSFGHTGFTGTSIWIDPERRLVIVLLANRVHPSRANARFGPVRGQVADRVVRGLGLERLSP